MSKIFIEPPFKSSIPHCPNLPINMRLVSHIKTKVQHVDDYEEHCSSYELYFFRFKELYHIWRFANQEELNIAADFVVNQRYY